MHEYYHHHHSSPSHYLAFTFKKQVTNLGSSKKVRLVPMELHNPKNGIKQKS
jgi:hypothetical protein